MTAAAWPETLPAPDADSVRIERVDPRQALKMDSGHVRRIRRATAAPFHIDARLLLDGAQLNRFRRFHRFDVRDGAWWFQAAWLDGLGLPGYAARFLEPPEIRRRTSLAYEVSIRLEAVDLSQAQDLQDWPISNIVTPAGVPLDHIAYWLKPDSMPYAPPHDFGNNAAIPSHHDPAVVARVRQEAALVSQGGFLALRLYGYTYYDSWSGPMNPGYLKIPFAAQYDLSVAMVYGGDPGVGPTLFNGPRHDVRNISYQLGLGNGPGDAVSAEPDRVRLATNGDAYSTNPQVSAPATYLRCAVGILPFRHGRASAWFNGQGAVSNITPRNALYDRHSGNSVPGQTLVLACNVGHAYIYEMVIWRKQLTAAEVAAVNNFFVDKYQIPL